MKYLWLLSIIGLNVPGIFSCNNTSEASDNINTEQTTGSVLTENNTLTKFEKQKGWKLLFDGKDLKGWHTFNYDKVTSGWEAQDGKMIFDPAKAGDDGGDLVTDGQYESFHLKLDWKISECGNSGILFLVQENGQKKTYHTGPEMQVLDNSCHSDAKYPTHRAGSLYDLIQAQPETVKPAGEWNMAEIILDNGHLIFKLNGTQVVETQMFNEKWEQMLAKSKFKRWPGFGTYKKGHIALQDHGNEVEFKNIKIKEL